MIIGMGSDLVDIRRIEKSLLRYGARFTIRCFTDTERTRADKSVKPELRAASYAKRFAAKEACAKALGTGIASGVTLRDIGVDNDDNGKPFIILTGGARKRLDEITPEGMRAQIMVTLSDEPPLAKADVIIQALPITG